MLVELESLVPEDEQPIINTAITATRRLTDPTFRPSTGTIIAEGTPDYFKKKFAEADTLAEALDVQRWKVE